MYNVYSPRIDHVFTNRPGVNGFEGEGLNVNRRVRGRQRRPPTSPGNKDSAAKVRHQGREFFKIFTRSF